jgi:hypothetical protein
VSKEEFATRFVTAQPDTADAIINRALEAGVSKREARSLLDAAVADRLVDKVTKGGRIKDTFSRPRETEPC